MTRYHWKGIRRKRGRHNYVLLRPQNTPPGTPSRPRPPPPTGGPSRCWGAGYKYLSTTVITVAKNIHILSRTDIADHRCPLPPGLPSKIKTKERGKMEGTREGAPERKEGKERGKRKRDEGKEEKRNTAPLRIPPFRPSPVIAV